VTRIAKRNYKTYLQKKTEVTAKNIEASAFSRHCTRYVLKLLHKGVNKIIEVKLLEEQSGFRKKKVTCRKYIYLDKNYKKDNLINKHIKSSLII